MFRSTLSLGLVTLTLCGCVTGAHAQSDPALDAGQSPVAPAIDSNAIRPSVAPATVAPMAVAPMAPPSLLSVPLVPNARLRVDLDAQDEDVLGVTKSFLRGFNGSTLKPLVQSLGTDRSPSGPVPNASTTAALSMLSDADLATLLENIHHLRIVAFETPRNFGSQSARTAGSQAVMSYYSQAYLTREGGRRVLRADFDEVQMLGVGFPNRGFAFVIQGPGFGAVMRADGYPNMESVGPVAMAMALYLGARDVSVLR